MKCPMYDSCTLKTGGCVASLPDNGCYWYRWFKDLIQKTENPWHTGTPTEEGNYIVHFCGKDADGESYEYDEVHEYKDLLKYIAIEDSHFKIVAWQKYEPYQGEKEK